MSMGSHALPHPHDFFLYKLPAIMYEHLPKISHQETEELEEQRAENYHET